MQANSLMLDLVTDNKTYLHDFLKLSDYAAFLENGIVNEQELMDIFNTYRNYGLCKVIFSQSALVTRNILQATPADSAGSTGIQNQDFLENFVSDSSDLDPEYFDLKTKGIALTHSSSYLWRLSKGPNRWELKNPSDKIQYSISANWPSQFKEFLEAESILDENSSKKWKLKCKNTGNKLQEFSVQLEAKNLKSLLIPKPLTFSTAVLIKCGPPTLLKLFPIRSDRHKLSTSVFSGYKFRDNSG